MTTLQKNLIALNKKVEEMRNRMGEAPQVTVDSIYGKSGDALALREIYDSSIPPNT